MENFQNKELLQFLLGQLTERRRALFENVLGQRTRHISVVMEDIYQKHNASAVIRSCDCFGIQDAYIIEERNEWDYSPDVEMGSSKWVSVHRFRENKGRNSELCLEALRKKGYRIVGTSPHAEDGSLDRLDLSTPTAFVFGTELEGISETVEKRSDELVKLPMYGFTESFNISVSAALTLFAARRKMEDAGIDWRLSERDKNELRYRWACKTIKRSEVLVDEFLKRFH